MYKKILSFAFCATIFGGMSFAEKLKDVSISGIQRIDRASVLDYLLIKVGDEIDQSRIEASLKKLYETGWFANVTLKETNGILYVNAEENSTVNQVSFEGNDAISDDILKTEIQIKPKQILTVSALKRESQKILELYRRKGRFGAVVEPKIIKRDQNRADVVFEIQEGGKTSIEKIGFIGAQKFSQSDLETEIVSKENRWYRFLTVTDTYDPERIEVDQSMLKKFYARHGYIDFATKSAIAEISEDRSDFYLSFLVDEGKQYKIRDIQFNIKASGVDQKKLLELINMEKGEIYNIEKIEEMSLKITDTLGEMGYAFINVEPRLKRNFETNEVDVVFEVEESQKIYVERIEISGNTKTLDRVIRREFLVKEGDPFNTLKLRTSLRNLRNLGFFEDMKIEQKRGSSPNKMIIKVLVKETSTLGGKFGLGYSSEDGKKNFLQGIRGTLSLKDTNFLGYGVHASFNGEMGAPVRGISAAELRKVSRDFNINVFHPHLFGYRIGGGGTLFTSIYDRIDIDGYRGESHGGVLNLRYYLSDDLYQKVSYSLNQSEIDTNPKIASTLFRTTADETKAGLKMMSSINLETSFDKRDRFSDTTSGYSISLSNTFAGLGGDIRFFNNELRLAGYVPITEKLVFSAKLKGGIITYIDNLRLQDRSFLGASTFHGFEYKGLGPRADAIKADGLEQRADALGGTKYYHGALELSYPIGSPELGIKLIGFLEAGDLWDSKIQRRPSDRFQDESYVRASAGLGLALNIPLLGKVRLSFSKTFRSTTYDITTPFNIEGGD